MSDQTKTPALDSARTRRRNLVLGAVAAALTGGRWTLAQAADKPQSKAQGPAWRVDGLYAEACSCDALCPCVLGAAPTQGYCQALLAWRVDKGSFGDARLDGFNAMLAIYSPGHLAKGGWKAALYVDERGSPSQRDALAGIFSGQAGGPLAGLAPLIAEVLGVKPVAIDFRADGKRRSFTVSGVAEAEVVGIEGAGGKPVILENPPISAVAEPSVLARSTRATYSDYGLSWTQSEKNGFFSPFTYTSG